MLFSDSVGSCVPIRFSFAKKCRSPSFDSYISLPDVNQLSARSVRHNTFGKHLDNLLVHVLRTVAADGTVARYDRDISSLLVETAGDRPRVPIARSDDDREADMNATLRQLEHELKKALRS